MARVQVLAGRLRSPALGAEVRDLCQHHSGHDGADDRGGTTSRCGKNCNVRYQLERTYVCMKVNKCVNKDDLTPEGVNLTPDRGEPHFQVGSHNRPVTLFSEDHAVFKLKNIEIAFIARMVMAKHGNGAAHLSLSLLCSCKLSFTSRRTRCKKVARRLRQTRASLSNYCHLPPPLTSDTTNNARLFKSPQRHICSIRLPNSRIKYCAFIMAVFKIRKRSWQPTYIINQTVLEKCICYAYGMQAITF